MALGWDAVDLGFVPGAQVEVIKTISGSIIIALDTTHPIEVTDFEPLEGGAAQLAMREARRAVPE